jgi:hypothetical protein
MRGTSKGARSGRGGGIRNSKCGNWEWERGWGKSFLEAGAEPQGNENASEEAGQISHQFAESDDEEGSNAHVCWVVDGDPTSLSLGKPR